MCLGALTGPRENPPSKWNKTLYTGLYLPTFEEGTVLFYVCFVPFRGGSPKSILGKTPIDYIILDVKLPEESEKIGHTLI